MFPSPSVTILLVGASFLTSTGGAFAADSNAPPENLSQPEVADLSGITLEEMLLISRDRNHRRRGATLADFGSIEICAQGHPRCRR